MKKIERIIVCLDLSDYDQSCIEMASYIHTALAHDVDITLLHNIRSDFIQKIKEVSTLKTSELILRIKNDINKKYHSAFANAHQDFYTKVTEEHQSDYSIINEINDKRSLIICGHKANADGLGVLPQRLIEKDKNQNPILLCPKRTTSIMDRILIASELKKHSVSLFQKFNSLHLLNETPIDVLKINKIPMSYFPYIVRKESPSEYNIEPINVKKIPQTILNTIDAQGYYQKDSPNIPKAILDFYNDSNFQLLTLGRVKYPNKNYPIGKIAKKVISLESKKPILIL